ncbi:MAG TPA: hypothetical protein DCY72_03990 [Ruminococcaceae bacterium]|nr:hypothetical protein [Oscillospiraceae bacterium]
MIRTKERNLRHTIFFTLKTIAIILVVCFALEYPVQMLGKAYAAEKVYYISEVKTFQAKTEAEAIKLCESDGYTCAKKDLNAGTDKDAVVMGYKLTENKDEAIYDIKLLHMNGGYQIKNYAEANEKLEKDNAGAGEALYEAANEFIANYQDGSPKAEQAYKGLNLFSIPEENNIGLGDFIVQDKADDNFFTKIVTRASSGALTAIANFLASGLTPLEKGKDQKTGKEKDISWADKVSDSPLWKILESKKTSKDELSTYDKEYGDDANAFFKQLQKFATDFETAQSAYDEGEYVDNAEKLSMDEAVEGSDEPTEEDRAMTYVNAYNFLNEYEAYQGRPLGEFLVDIGKKTSDKVDLRRLYPVMEQMTSAQRRMIGLVGVLPLIGCLGENKATADAEKILNRAKAKIKEKMGENSFSVWINTNPELADKKVAFTSDAIRLNAAQQMVSQKTDMDKWNDAKKIVNDVLKWINVGSSVLFVLTWIAGNYGLAGLVLKTATTAVASTIAAIASKSIAISAAVSSWTGIFSLVILAVTILFAIISLIIDAILKSKPKEYTEMADFAVDTKIEDGNNINLIYEAVKDNQGRIADLNAYEAQNGWLCMYTSKDERSGSPLRADANGNVFDIVYGDASTPNGYECTSVFGQISPANCNTGAKSDDVNGIFINYRTERSIANSSPEANTGTQQKSSGSKTYYADLVLVSGKDPDIVKAKITKMKGNYQVFDQNLCADVGDKVRDEPQYTYLAYTVTGNPKLAVRDIRVATFQNGGEIKFGSNSYGCAGTLGYPANDKNEDKSFPGDLDGLYFTRDENAGSPIEVGKLHLVSSHSEAKAGWEPVTTFSGLPYNFATTRISAEDDKDPARLRMYSYSYTAYHTKKDNTWDNADRYLYYEPEVTYTSGTKYLSGVFFGFGPDSESGVGYSGSTVSKVTQLFDKLSDLPNVEEPSASSGVNLAQSYFYKGFVVDSNQKYMRIYYSWTYNPYRALTDVQAFRGSPYTSHLPLFLSKSISVSGKETSASYAAASVAVQRSVDQLEIIRAISPENAYMAPCGLLGQNTEVCEGFTREAQGGFTFSDGKMTLLPTNLYVSGYVKGRPGLTLDDVVVSTSARQGVNNGGKLTCDVSEDKTLAGNTPEGDFFSVQEFKDPHNLTPFNIAYPSWTDDGGNAKKSDEDNGDHYHAGTSVYMYIKHPVVRKKYISKILVGAAVREDVKDTFENKNKEPTDDELEAFDKQVDLKAMSEAVSAGTDEMIPCDVAGDPTKAWYNYVKADSEPKPPKKGDPAAYLSVTRTDDVDKAIRSVLLYESDAKNTPDQLQFDRATYYCASNSTPIKMNNGNTYFVYYSYNQGTVPGKPITELEISDKVFISGSSTALVVNKADVIGKKNGKNVVTEPAVPFGDSRMEVFIHAKYDVTTSYFSKIYTASGDTAKEAQLSLLEQGCTEFCDIDLNRGVGGKFVYLGYRGYSLDEDAINEKTSESAKEAEKQEQLYEAVYDIICTVGEEFHPEGIVSERHQIYYAPVVRYDRNKNPVPTDLNEGTNGPKIYMYYTTMYAADDYNERMRSEEDPIFSTMPKEYMKSPLTKIGFALYDYVPYSQDMEAASTGTDNKVIPWEYVMKSDNKEHLELNEGAVSFDKHHMTGDNRIYMFAQREAGNVKASAEITGGYTTASVTENKLYLEQ